jgi:anti-sigma factor RsiW
MTADPYARLDAVYLLGALDADERLAYEAHLAICRRGRAGLAEISAIPSLLAGLDESVFAAPPEVAPTPVPDTLLPACRLTHRHGDCQLASVVPRSSWSLPAAVLERAESRSVAERPPGRRRIYSGIAQISCRDE